ncbi:hypothetical protein FRC19_000624 [Serendipita sp. 401]|nr:hypothetical protein FRC19_000624 [Serendipita sp. 401]KAG9055900.1 hypothetical protein FS842_000815 [Serendipita sp. 407]
MNHNADHQHGHLVDDTDVHESARIQVDYLSHKWQEADVWHTWKNMTRQKNDIANGVRLENASWRTWWQTKGKLKTISPQKLNWLKDSDVTWLYGPLHQAPVPALPPKGASLQEKLKTIPPLPKARKPILKKRTLAEVLVLGLAKTNNLPSASSPGDEMKELDIPSQTVKGPEERDRIMLLHTKSDTNLLRPAIGRVQQLSPPLENEPSTPRRPTRFGPQRESFSTSNKASPSPPPHDHDGIVKKRVGFNAFVSQCIAIAPGERNSSDDGGSDDDALSMKSAGSGSNRPRRPSTSRSNSHSSARSEPLIIAPMAPTLLKETMGDEEASDGPTVVYMPLGSPFDGKDSDSDDDFGHSTVPPKVVTISEPENIQESMQEITFGTDANKKRKLSVGEVPPSRRQHRDAEETPSTSSIEPPPATRDSLLGPPIVQTDDSRGRTLHRTSSSSSLNERSRSCNGSSPIGSRSPESSRASSTSTRGTSAEIGPTALTGREANTGEKKATVSTSGPIIEDATIQHDDYVKLDNKGLDGGVSMPITTKQESGGGFVDKAVANARGLIGTLLNGSSASTTGKRNSS